MTPTAHSSAIVRPSRIPHAAIAALFRGTFVSPSSSPDTSQGRFVADNVDFPLWLEDNTMIEVTRVSQKPFVAGTRQTHVSAGVGAASRYDWGRKP